jgi:hypothetical protein
MLLGTELGRHSLGQLPGGRNGVAVGVTLTIEATLTAGVAVGETLPVRFMGGRTFTRPRNTVPGVTMTVGTSIISGVAQVGHEITINQADGTTRMVVIYGARDEELRDPDFIIGVIYDDWDLWLIKQRKAA